MVERPLIKPEVRGAIPRISKIKDIEFSSENYWILKSYTRNTFPENF